MKLVRLCTVYPDYLESFYRKRPEFEKSGFQEQHDALMYDGFGWADFWKHSLGPLGYEVAEVVANAESMQRAWGKEKGYPQPGSDWLLNLAEKQVKDFQPEILFITDYVIFKRRWIETLRSRCPSIRMVVGWCGAPFPDEEVFKAYDLVLSCVPELVELFKKMGHRSRHLNHAFDQRILGRIDTQRSKDLGFTFIGQISRQAGFHLEREKLLLHLVERVPITIYSMTKNIRWSRYIRSFAMKSLQASYDAMRWVGLPAGILARVPLISRGPEYRDYPLFPIHPGLKTHLHHPVFGLEMFQVIHDSSLTFNNHLNVSRHSASNMRMFEATGVGTCLLTDNKDRISTLFEPDCEIVTYRSADECVEKVLYLLEHEEEREAIAKAGQARTAKDHNFQVRAGELDTILKEEIQRGAS